MRGVSEDASQVPSNPRYWRFDDELPPINLVDERNPLLENSGLEDKKKAVILIHGWNPDAVEDPLKWGVEWRLLSEQLESKLDEADFKREWAIIHFNWSKAAATGPKINPTTAEMAAYNGNRFGYDYAKELNTSCPDLRRVHFIAHSAGTWLARRAIIELMRLNPMVVCELTLLDPFVPSRTGYILNQTSQEIELLANIPNSNNRLWKIQNIWAKDITTGTDGDFSWASPNIGSNFRVDTGLDSNSYDYHSGPILFYSDTIEFTRSWHSENDDLKKTPNQPAWKNYGADGGFWNMEVIFPNIKSHLPNDYYNILRPYGQKVSLQVTLNNPTGCTYQWYLLQSQGSGKILTPVTVPLIGNGPTLEVPIGNSKAQYVCGVEKLSQWKTFSSVFTVSPDLGAALITTPSISAMSPSSPSADSSGSQSVSVMGRGFQASANTTAILTSPSGTTSTYIPTVTSSTQLSFDHSFSGKPGTWSLVVKKGTNLSAPLSFRVTSTTPTTAPRVLSRIAIDNLPGSVFEGQTISNVGIRKYYSDGTNSTVTAPSSANWNVQYGTLTFSSPSTFAVSQVTADVSETVTANYTEGGVTKTSLPSSITILNNTSGGGVVTGEIVKNGTLENNGAYWTANNADFHITSDYSFGGHTGGYAWMATPAGGQGNNLAGAFWQVIDLPSNASQLSLKFSCAISVQNSSAATSADRVSVILRDENDLNSVNLISVDPVNQPAALGQWVTYSVDLTRFKGTRKKLVFGGGTDSTNPATLRVDDVRVEITAGMPTLVDLAITGADAVTEGTASSYKALANLSNGTATDVTTSTVWSVNENATISGGNLMALQVIAQRTARITASYSSGGITKTVTKDVTIVDTAPVPVSLAIYGPGEIDENSGGSFSAVMQLSTGVYQDITSSVYWSFTGSGGQVDQTGRIFTHEVSADTNLTVKAAYEQNGVTVNAQTTLRILDRLPPVLPTSIAIVGPSSVNEAEIGLFDAQVTYADGTTKFVNPSWLENSRFAAISEYGVLACEEVLSNQTATLSISYTENSSTVTATKTVTIANTKNTEAKPEITMPAFMEIPVDRVANLRLQTAHPVVSATATGLPPGLTFNSSTFEIQGTPSDVGTWEVSLSATNDFGSTTGTLLLTVSEDAGPEWIRFTRAEALKTDTIGITSDGQGGCYLYGYNTVSHRNAAGVFDFNTGPMGVQIHSVSGSPSGFALSGRFDATFAVGGRTINKFSNGEGEAVVIIFNKAGQALWHETAHSTYKNVNPGPVVLNADGSLFWGLNYFASVGFQTLGVGVELLNPSNPGQMDCTVIKVNSNYTFAWGHRWGGNQQDEISEITSNTVFACRVKVNSRSSSLTRNELPYVGLYPTQWNKGNSSIDFHLIESVYERGSYAEAQLDSADSYAYPLDLISDPSADYKFWIAGNFKGSALFKRFENGVVSENISLPAASNSKMSGFVIKSGFSTQSTTSSALFRSLAPSVYGVNEVFVRRIASMSDGSVLSVGTYTPSFDYNGSKFLDSPQDYAQTDANKRAFIAGHDSSNNMKWVLACGGINGGIPTHLENVGNDKWVMLCNSSGDAKFGRLPVIPGGGLILVDIERKVPLPEIRQADEKWRSYGFTAGEFSTLRAGGATNDLFSLSTDQGDLSQPFKSSINAYSASVSHEVATIKLLPIAYSSSISVNGSSVISGSASQSIPLVVGSNVITTTVTAQDGVATKIYTVTVTRAATASSISTLSGLTLSHGLLSPAFAPGVTNYTTNVANTVNSITVIATVNDVTANLKVNGGSVTSSIASAPIPLNVGTNSITVTVTAQDGVTIKIYTVTVTRAAVSTLALSGLEVSDGLLTPEFAADNTNYTVKVANTVSSILVIGAVSDATANVKVNGILAPYRNASVLVSLNVGSNTINVKVTAKDGTTNKTYTILVTRAPLSGAFLQGLSVKGVGMNPKFKSGTTNYTARVGKATAKIKLTATATPTGTAIKVNGVAIKSGSLSKAIPLKVGKNTIKIVVAAQDGNTKTYKIIVTRSSAAASSLKSVAIVPSAESAMIIASAPEIARTTMVMIGGCKYLQLTMQKEDPAVRRIVEVSPNLIDWFSGDRHTTVLVDNRTILSVRDNTPTTAGAKRYIRVRKDRN